MVHGLSWLWVFIQILHGLLNQMQNSLQTLSDPLYHQLATTVPRN